MYIKYEVMLMPISKKIKSLLIENDKKQSDLMEVLGMSSKQSLSNKFSNERWSADDLVKIADFCGCKLAFVLPNGERIVIENKDTEE
jgi:DNA-binding Xre family transcriptional regulator